MNEGSARVLTPGNDGRLRSERALLTAFMAPRLQGEHHPDGRLELSLWGAGRLGRVRTTPLRGPFSYGPNGVVGAAGALHVARSTPVLVLRGTGLVRVTPARRSAGWADAGPPAVVRREGARWSVDLGWGALRLEQRGADLVIAAGADGAEAERGLALSVEAIVGEGEAYAAACDRMPVADLLLRSLVLQGAHAAWSSVRQDAAGRFAGLAAGMAYSAPARTYYRDGYWTLPMLLRLEPEAARAAVLMLADGVQADGEAPSAVVLGGQRAWETSQAAEHARPGEWWSDHFDSPLFFVLAVDLVAGATSDETLVEACRPQMLAVFERYLRLAAAGAGLPLKPRHDRDWADNVFRSGAVAYDLGLWAGVLEVMGRRGGPTVMARAAEALAGLRRGLERLWLQAGWYAEFAALDGFVEKRLALDSLTLLRFGAVSETRARAVLDAVDGRLRADWGVPCGSPAYARRGDLRSKTAFPGRYHNGGDWPWLDGLYAAELLRRGRHGWRHPLTRWWETGLEQGWTSSVEWFSPPFGRGSLLQAWSSLPAAVALAYPDAVLAGDPEH